jgi:hypothetical protein
VNRRVTLWLGAGLLLLYFFTSSGGFESGDTVLRYETARSWLAGRGGALDPKLGWDGGAVLPDGRVYAFFGPLQPALMVPFVLAARALPSGGLDASVLETFAISLGLFPLVSTAAMLVLFRALLLLGYPARAALAAVLAVAVGTMFWHYARMGQEEHLVALGFAVWLYGAARLIAGRPWPAVFLALGASIALATRWAVAPQLAVLCVVTLALLVRFRERVRIADLALGTLLPLATASLLLLYNHTRFGDWLETGYGIWYAHYNLVMFQSHGFANNAAALLFSPYRGLVFYSTLALAAIAGTFLIPRGPVRTLGWGALAVLSMAVLFFASFHFWSGGHSWGPRFLVAPQVLLAPAFAALFARRPRWALLVPLAAGLQLFSVMLPASTEEYVRFNLEQARPGYCTEWRFACSPVPSRIPRALSALANTAANRPGTVLSGRPVVAPEVVLQTSDYRTLYWWPVRIAFRLGLMPAWAALTICLLGVAAAVACLTRSWRLT